MEDFNSTLLTLNETINKKEQEILDKNKELEDLKHEHLCILKQRNNALALKEIENFIDLHGNILDKKLHDELRLKLIEIVYRELYFASYDLVLRLILNKLNVRHEYLSKKGEPILLQITIN